uniref:Putative secreted protein n=1 Tax=Ixodes ricinus TaxID=34613 RepID=A0A6B0UBD4_IXORI
MFYALFFHLGLDIILTTLRATIPRRWCADFVSQILQNLMHGSEAFQSKPVCFLVISSVTNEHGAVNLTRTQTNPT